MTRISDVAQRANVSSATVSRALSGDIHVDSVTRQRVLDSAAALDYRLDGTARAMRRRRSDLIGLVISTIENPFFTEVAHAAEHAAQQRGYSLIICNTDEDPVEEQRYLNLLDTLLASGVILAPAPGTSLYLHRFIGGRLPIVLINRTLELPFPSVVCDDEDAAYECTSLLAQRGAKRIGAVTGLPDTSTTHNRLRGYHRALTDAGLASESQWEIFGGATVQGGYRAAQRLMSNGHAPDALLCFNNVMTQGGVMALMDMGMRWPDDVDIAGFGVFSTARLYRPPLTLVSQPTHEMGRRAVEMILDHPVQAAPAPVILQNRVVQSNAWPADNVAMTSAAHNIN